MAFVFLHKLITYGTWLLSFVSIVISRTLFDKIKLCTVCCTCISFRWSVGPTPDSINIFGDPKAPADTITSLEADTFLISPCRKYCTPTASLPSNSTYKCKYLSVIVWRLGRPIFVIHLCCILVVCYVHIYPQIIPDERILGKGVANGWQKSHLNISQ